MRVHTILAAVLVLAAAGCGDAPEAKFALNEKTKELIPEARVEVEKTLLENFGTPTNLVAWQKFPVDYGEATKDEDHPERSDAGWKMKDGRNLYMTHCLHCHGVAGDGNGPTARFLNPRPRDYRQGTFKFKSTQAAVMPSRDDLKRILKDGIPGTYMPSFVLLGDEKLGAIVEYVRWLSIRGRTEISMANEFAAAGALDKDVRRQMADEKSDRKKVVADVMKTIGDDLTDTIASATGDVAEAWAAAEEPDSIVVPKVKRTPPTKESLERGKKLYLSQVEGKKTQCADCHGPTGRGDGPNTELFWAIPGTTPERKYEDAGLHDDWGFPQQPRNLTRGVYRGGRRPIDLYRRIFSGIKGTQMPAFGGTVLKDEEIWDVVNYVLSIPFEGKQSAAPAEAEVAEQPESNKVAASEK